MAWGRKRRVAIETIEPRWEQDFTPAAAPPPDPAPEPEPAPSVDPAEAVAAGALVTRLQSRRLLFDPPSLGLVGSIPAGAAAVMADLVELGDGVAPDSVLGTSIRELRGACHDLGSRVELPTHLWRQMGDEAALLALGTFRGIVAANLVRWQVAYDLVIAEPLAAILPSPDVPDVPDPSDEPMEASE